MKIQGLLNPFSASELQDEFGNYWTAPDDRALTYIRDLGELEPGLVKDLEAANIPYMGADGRGDLALDSADFPDSAYKAKLDIVRNIAVQIGQLLLTDMPRTLRHTRVFPNNAIDLHDDKVITGNGPHIDREPEEDEIGFDLQGVTSAPGTGFYKMTRATANKPRQSLSNVHIDMLRQNRNSQLKAVADTTLWFEGTIDGPQSFIISQPGHVYLTPAGTWHRALNRKDPLPARSQMSADRKVILHMERAKL